jgi:hypothetical protein
VQITPDAQQPIVSSQGIHKAVAMVPGSGKYFSDVEKTKLTSHGAHI